MIASAPRFVEGYRWRVNPDEAIGVITICPSRFSEFIPENKKALAEFFQRGPYAPFELKPSLLEVVISVVVASSPTPKVDAGVISS